MLFYRWLMHGFQSLIGRLQTQTLLTDGELEHAFQSLIGRLQTHHHESQLLSSDPGFQSLIGRLQTRGVIPRTCLLSGFQSLIGRLQTLRSSELGRLRSRVSIPHR